MSAARRQIPAILLLALLVAGVGSLPAYGAAADRAKSFIEIATRAQERAVALRALALAGGANVSAADALIADGNTSLAAAVTAHEAAPPNFETAASEAKDAAASFREALQLLGETVGDAGLESDQAAQGLLEAIANHRRRLQRLNATIQAIEDASPTPVPPETQALLDQADNELTAAGSEFDAAEALLYASSVDVPVATQHITSGLGHLQAAFAAIRGVEDWTDTWKAQNFLAPLLRQIDRLQADIDQAASEGKATTAVEAKLDLARDHYQGAKDLLASGDKKGALELLREIHKLLSDIREDLAQL